MTNKLQEKYVEFVQRVARQKLLDEGYNDLLIALEEMVSEAQRLDDMRLAAQ